MKLTTRALIFVLVILFSSMYARAQEHIEQWDRIEISLPGTQTGNPFDDATLSATFTNGTEKHTVNGFYDGNGEFKIRFMPETTGTWTYFTQSNRNELAGKTGTFVCVNAAGENHGPVRVRGKFNFEYADGTPYYPFGTTVYAMIHQPDELLEQTFQTLERAPFNKIRICVFPKNYAFNDNEPPVYPFEKIAGESPEGINKIAVWDFARFNPAFFERLEATIERLDGLGIQCDLILFHPYDKGHWGFDRMSHENDLRYLRYITARLSSFRNVWWSMANEFDYMKEKTPADWDSFLETVASNDPYGHLRGNHNGDSLFNQKHPLITHASIQTASMLSDFGRAGILRDAYQKPVVYDEFCYEGDFEQRWGNLSGQELVHRFWQGAITGAYMTHGETFRSDDNIVWWAKGGILKGESPARIAFLRQLIERGGSFKIIDNWRNLNTAVSESGQILVYFGKETPKEWVVNLPAKTQFPNGTRLKIEMIDTWNMTITELSDTFVTKSETRYIIGEASGRKVKLPGKPYMALLITKLD